MNEVIDYLLNFAFEHGIGFKMIPGNPNQPSASMPRLKFMIINLNWKNKKELPFIIGHEIGHIMLGDNGVMYYRSFSGQCSQEKPADLYSLKLLYGYSIKRGDGFTEPGNFMEAYGIPANMKNATEQLFRAESEF